MVLLLKECVLSILSLICRQKSDRHLYRISVNQGGVVKKLASMLFMKRVRDNGSSIGNLNCFKEYPILPHGFLGIFISQDAKIGKNCVIFQQVTIGSNMLLDSKGMGAPTIGDNVYIGAGAKIIGNVHVGDNCRIGANAVVVKDVPDNTTVFMGSILYRTKEKKMDNRFVIKKDNKLFVVDSDGVEHNIT